MDSAQLQEEDAEFKSKRHKREGRKGPYLEIPLYTVEDARASFSCFSPCEYKQPVRIGDGLQATFYDAGHILGSSMVEVRVLQDGQDRKIVFSGDVGRWDKPILRDPTVFVRADYVLIESTYGDRLHKDTEDVGSRLADIVNRTHEAGGNIVIPSFATERAQEVLYHLNRLLLDDQIPHLLVFLDSPMAANVTRVFEHHPELFDEKMTELVKKRESPFHFFGLKQVRSVKESKAINHIKGTVIIMAGSGMCTGGRIKHHLVRNIARPESTVLFVGYQAVDTLGRHIVDRAKEVRILGQRYPVRTRIEQISGFSAHADKNELLKWLAGLEKAPRHVFVTHGEPETAERFAGFVKEQFGWETSVPSYEEEVILD